MTIVKSNVCKSCGGLLDIDIDRQVYICQYCGVTYDYEYFREDNVQELAKKALERSEFGAAKDAFDFILKKDPHDFEALRGLFLCRCKWRDMFPIYKYTNVRFKENDTVLNNVIDNCQPQHKDYFLKIKEASGIVQKFYDNSKQIEKLEDEKKSKLKLRDEYDLQRAINDTKFVDKFKELRESMGYNGKSFLDVIIYFGFVIVAFLSAFVTWWIAVATVLIILACVVIYNIKKIKKNKKIESQLSEVYVKMNELDNEIDDKKAERGRILTKYKTKANEIMEIDPKPFKRL